MMAGTSNAKPIGSDGGRKGGRPENRGASSRFEWVASAPSPADVAALELRFPDVIQVPVHPLEDDVLEWKEKAVIARSLSRWIPSEAIVREFRRAGVSGPVECVSLAHRHYLFRFTDQSVKKSVLGRPWMVNGQMLAMEDWRPQFVPAEDTLPSSLLWIRLPQLPIEFWSEESIGAILSVAGEFQFIDSATRDRKRGGFARGCVRVNLRSPLRPGARVRGVDSPFWQPFVFEHVEGICSDCGAVHGAGKCSPSPAAATQSGSLAYGPWMAALRRRRPPLQSEAVAEPIVQPVAEEVNEGWQLPKKLARRNTGRRTAPPVIAGRGSGLQLGDGSCSLNQGESQTSGSVPKPSEADISAKEKSVPVTVESELFNVSIHQNTSSSNMMNSQLLKRNGKDNTLISGFKFTAMVEDSIPVTKEQKSVKMKEPLIQDGEKGPVIQMEAISSSPGLQMASTRKVATNPFGLQGSDRWAGVPKVREDANPVLLKRARPAESIAPRVSPKSVKGKGKGGGGVQGAKGRGEKGSVIFLGDPQLPSLDSCAHQAIVTTVKETLLLPTVPDHQGDVEMESSQLTAPSEQGIVEESSSVEGHSGMEMTGSLDGAQSIPNSD